MENRNRNWVGVLILSVGLVTIAHAKPKKAKRAPAAKPPEASVRQLDLKEIARDVASKASEVTNYGTKFCKLQNSTGQAQVYECSDKRFPYMAITSEWATDLEQGVSLSVGKGAKLTLEDLEKVFGPATAVPNDGHGVTSFTFAKIAGEKRAAEPVAFFTVPTIKVNKQTPVFRLLIRGANK